MKIPQKMQAMGLILVTTVSFSISAASADWKGNFDTKVSEKNKGTDREFSGVMSFRSALKSVRIDVSSPMAMSMIANLRTKEAFTLMHPAKLIMGTDLNKLLNDQAPVCLGEDAEACFKKLGLKKTGHEKIGSRNCTVFEGKINEADTKLWHPDGMKDFPALKSTVVTKEGTTVETVFSDVMEKPVAAKLFEKPSDYHAGGNLNNLLKGFQNFKPNP